MSRFRLHDKNNDSDDVISVLLGQRALERARESRVVQQVADPAGIAGRELSAHRASLRDKDALIFNLLVSSKAR